MPLAPCTRNACSPRLGWIPCGQGDTGARSGESTSAASIANVIKYSMTDNCENMLRKLRTYVYWFVSGLPVKVKITLPMLSTYRARFFIQNQEYVYFPILRIFKYCMQLPFGPSGVSGAIVPRPVTKAADHGRGSASLAGGTIPVQGLQSIWNTARRGNALSSRNVRAFSFTSD